MIKEHHVLKEIVPRGSQPGLTASVLKRKQSLASRITHTIETV
jgi:hypothetical protein